MLDDLPIFVDEPPVYEPRGDHIVSRWKNREFHIPIAVAQRMVGRLGKALDQWRIDQTGKVAKLPLDHAAAS